MTKRERQYLIAGTLTRPEDSWCNKCLKPAMWEGKIWSLYSTGVGLWGYIRGCHSCDKWVRTPKERRNII